MTFWRDKPMAQLSPDEWEQLCDGCGLCCQIRYQDIDTDEIILADVACNFLNLSTHQCSDYANRKRIQPLCVQVTPENVHDLDWLPHSCAYRLVAFGHDLPDWHHLICGDRDRVHRDGPSMRGELIHEKDAGASE